MRFTFFIVVALWSFIGILVAVAVTVNHNKEVSFFGPTPVRHPNQSVYLLPDD